MAFPALSPSPRPAPGLWGVSDRNAQSPASVIYCRALARGPLQPRQNGVPRALRVHEPCGRDARPSHSCRPGDALPLPCGDEPHARDVLLPSGDALLLLWTCNVSPSFNKVFQLAIIPTWEDLMNLTKPISPLHYAFPFSGADANNICSWRCYSVALTASGSESL